MKIPTAFLLLAASVQLAGCVHPPKKQDLAIPAICKTFVLKERVSAVSRVGIGYRMEHGALPGAYTAEREDETGTYYFGEGRAIWETHELIQKIPRLRHGGVFVPAAADQAPGLFFVFEREVVTTQNLDAYMQSRIVQATAAPAGVMPGAGLGATVAGNVIGGAIVSAIIDAGVGDMIRTPAPLAGPEAEKVTEALRLARPVACQAK